MENIAEARKKVLDMLQDGKISAEDAVKLLEALKPQFPPMPPMPPMPPHHRMHRKYNGHHSDDCCVEVMRHPGGKKIITKKVFRHGPGHKKVIVKVHGDDVAEIECCDE